LEESVVTQLFIDAIGEDYRNGFIALTDRQHQRAQLFAEAVTAAENAKFRKRPVWAGINSTASGEVGVRHGGGRLGVTTF
jgi:L-aminopeptidase/D-esterase-like protein